MVTNNQVNELRQTVASTNLGGAGFQLPRRRAELRFAGSDYDGAIVEAWLDVPMDLFLELRDSLTSEDAMAVYGLFSQHCLIGWNLQEEQGRPLPATTEGMNRVWPNFGRLIIQEWMEGVMTPPAPLSEPSSNGATLDEASIPMEPLAASPGNYSEPR